MLVAVHGCGCLQRSVLLRGKSDCTYDVQSSETPIPSGSESDMLGFVSILAITIFVLSVQMEGVRGFRSTPLGQWG